MVKYFTVLIILLYTVNTAFAEDADATIESAFHAFFGEPMKLIMNDKEVKLIVNKIEEDARQIPVKMLFNVSSVEKVLLLKLRNTGYSNTGYYNRKCAKEPVFISAYTLDPDKHISQIKTRMHTYCGADTITLLLWAKTLDSQYYSTSLTFKTTTESPG